PRPPPALERMIPRCLAKDPDARWQNAGDLAAQLRDIAAPGAPSHVATRRFGSPAWLIAASLAAVAIIAVVIARRLETGTAVPPPAGPRLVPLTTYPGIERNPAFSPDGRQIAFSWNGPEQDNFDIY